MMKKTIFQPIRLLILTIACGCLYTIQSSAQIVFDHSYPYSGTIVNLEKDGPKFYLMDVPANECRIYNLDYTLFKKINLQVPSNRYLYDVQLVSQNLFDTDDGVELLYVFYQYVQTTNSYYYIYTTRIADENGSVLLDLPGGSWTEVINLDIGSRMLVYITDYSVYPYPVETRIYKLPGQLSGLNEDPLPNYSADRVFPNPTTGSLNLKSDRLSHNDKADWVILDSSGKFIARIPALNPNTPIDLKSIGLVSGVYLVRLESKNFQTKFQQVVLNN
jgi:hypothetical protein